MILSAGALSLCMCLIVLSVSIQVLAPEFVQTVSAETTLTKAAEPTQARPTATPPLTNTPKSVVIELDDPPTATSVPPTELPTEVPSVVPPTDIPTLEPTTTELITDFSLLPECAFEDGVAIGLVLEAVRFSDITASAVLLSDGDAPDVANFLVTVSSNEDKLLEAYPQLLHCSLSARMMTTVRDLYADYRTIAQYRLEELTGGESRLALYESNILNASVLLDDVLAQLDELGVLIGE